MNMAASGWCNFISITSETSSIKFPPSFGTLPVSIWGRKSTTGLGWLSTKRSSPSIKYALMFVTAREKSAPYIVFFSFLVRAAISATIFYERFNFRSIPNRYRFTQLEWLWKFTLTNPTPYCRWAHRKLTWLICGGC